MKRFLTALLIGVVFAGAAQGEMMHRYDFLSDVQDSIGGAHGILVDPLSIATFAGGRLHLNNSGIENSNQSPFTVGAYVNLPNGIISALGPVATFEIWTTYRGNNSWEQIYSFGINGGGEDQATCLSGPNPTAFVMLCPQDNAGVLRFQEYPGGVIQDSTRLQSDVEEVLFLTFDSDGVMTAYRNGQLIGSATTVNSLPNLNDVNNWLGRSQCGDPLYEGAYNELRIYNEIRSEYELKADLLAGPDASPASVVYPADGATGVSQNPTLEWAEGPVEPNDVIGYKIFIGDTDANNVWMATTPTDTLGAVTTWTPPTSLNSYTYYYWRVDILLDSGQQIKGPVWSFRTLRLIPEIVGPEATQVSVGETAQFTIGITSASAVVDCDWYKVDAGGDILLDPASAKYDVVFSDTASTLSIYDVAATDEGDYYAIVTNADGPAQSDSAPLRINRLIGYWPFDSNLDDVTSGFDGTALDGSAVYASGIAGDAVDFRGLNYRITVPTDAYVVDDFGWTLTWWEWADPDRTGVTWNWETMLASGPSVGNEAFQLSRWYATGYDLFIAGTWINEQNTAPRGEWYFHAVAYDQTTGQATWYRNGRAIRTWNAGNPVLDTVIYIGDERGPVGEKNEFKGFIDELKFYNYPRDKFDIAADYHALRPGDPSCVEYPEYDISGPAEIRDCMVDLYDLEAIASEWLKSNMRP